MEERFTFLDVLKNYYSSTEINILHHKKIGIAGAGGIGSNCAITLVRCGFSHFSIADFDRVTISNLNRQIYLAEHNNRLKVKCLQELCSAINPAVRIDTFPVRVDSTSVRDIFNSCDIIIEAFDDPESKTLLFNEYLHSGKLLVGVSGISGIGNSDRIAIRKIHENCFIVGDETTGVSESQKPYAPIVTIAAAKMADLVLSKVLGRQPTS